MGSGTVIRRAALPAAAVALVAGCADISYYGHLAAGQLELMSRREPIPEVIARRHERPGLQARLERVQAIRRFAVEALALPAGESYTTYAELDRAYAVWNVFAAPELSLELETWCYPLIGCAAYRGYFGPERAHAHAERLRRRGYDVYVAGIAAYSTLGWFDDPVTDTILRLPEPELAGLLFHELAHHRVYVSGATAFNESFAVTVERVGVRRWLTGRGEARALAAWREGQRGEEAFVARVLEAKRRLREIYASDRDPEAMRAAKAAALESLRASVAPLFPGGLPPWLEELNNAKLGAVAAYWEYVPAFEALLARHDGELEAFYRAVDRLAVLSEAQRRERLAALGAGAPEPDAE